MCLTLIAASDSLVLNLYFDSQLASLYQSLVPLLLLKVRIYSSLAHFIRLLLRNSSCLSEIAVKAILYWGSDTSKSVDTITSALSASLVENSGVIGWSSWSESAVPSMDLWMASASEAISSSGESESVQSSSSPRFSCYNCIAVLFDLG